MRDAGISSLRTAVALRDDDAARHEFSTDFGGMIRRVPSAVVTPRSPEDVRRTVDFACRARRPVAVRGAGHSQAGQSLTDGGILLDMTSLDRVGEIRDGAVRVQAGATWRKLVRRARAAGQVPTVLTTNLDATIGGTLSMAGFGTSSHRYGAQADNVDELVVVTGDARQLRCSRTENPVLFDCVRCGLGQFAVITEARVRLRRRLPNLRTFRLAYDDIHALMLDQRQAISDDRFEHIAASCVSRVAGIERLFARSSPFTKRLYVMSLAAEFDREFDADVALAGLEHGRLLGTQDGSTGDVLLGTDRPGSGTRKDRSLAHPWIEGILPWRNAGRGVAEILAELPSALPPDTEVLLWAAPGNRFGAPMLARPAGEWLMGLAVLPAVEPMTLARLLPGLEAAGRRLTAMGGKRYLSGWIDYDHERWRAHFGDLWPRLVESKQAFDPHGVLNPGFVRFRPTASD